MNASFRTTRLVLLVIASGVACILAACTALSTHPDQASSQASSPTSKAREVTDDLGRRVVLPQHLERVVSLAPNLTEIVFAIGAGNRLVGDTEYCDYPDEAKALPKVGDTLHPNVERVVALHPQLVLVSTSSQLESFLGQLNEEQIPAYVTDATDLDKVFSSIKKIGDLFGERERADELVRNLQRRTQAVENAVRNTSPFTVFYQLSPQPLYTAGSESFVTDLIRRAGGVSVTEKVPGAWPRFSDESALASRPQSIIIATSGVPETDRTEVAAPLRRSPAVSTGRVYKINGDYLSRPGPRLIDGLEQMARVLHPEAFK